MSKKSVNNKLGKLKKATESFRATKKQQIARICSVGRKHKILKYPSLIAAILFILFVDIVFYLFLFVLLDKKRALGIALVLVALIGFLFVESEVLQVTFILMKRVILFSYLRVDTFILWEQIQQTEVQKRQMFLLVRNSLYMLHQIL